MQYPPHSYTVMSCKNISCRCACSSDHCRMLSSLFFHGLCPQTLLEKPFSSPWVLMPVCAFSKDWPLSWGFYSSLDALGTVPLMTLCPQHTVKSSLCLSCSWLFKISDSTDTYSPCYTIPTSKFKIQSIWENVTPTKSLKLPYSTFKTDEAKVSLRQLQLKVWVTISRLVWVLLGCGIDTLTLTPPHPYSVLTFVWPVWCLPPQSLTWIKFSGLGIWLTSHLVCLAWPFVRFAEVLLDHSPAFICSLIHSFPSSWSTDHNSLWFLLAQ